MSEIEKTTPRLPSPRAAAYPGHWKGRFIWDRGASLPHNAYMMCRKTLQLEDAPEAAQIHITAAIKYKLWVNGKYVGSGPARSFPEWKSYDTHGLSGVLEAGKNVISVLCWFTGIPNNYSADERAGLWAQIEYIDGSGQLHETGTDESWRLRQAQGFRRDVSHFRGIMAEIHDSRLDPQDWLDVDFDDSQWVNATCLVSGEYRASPQMMASWTYMEPRQTPLMREREVEPREVAFVGEADASFYPEIANIVERASGQELFPLQYAKAEGADTLVGASGGKALFQNNRPSSEDTPTDNLLANRKCYVFAPPEDAEPLLPGETFQNIPESMVFGTKVCKQQQGFIGSDGEINLAPLIGGVCEYRPAYIYVPFSIEEEREFIIGAGADWWMECHVDGEKIFDTMHYGNGFHPPHYSNFRKKLTFQRGTHLLVARICSGALGSVFSCGIIPASPADATVRDPFITIPAHFGTNVVYYMLLKNLEEIAGRLNYPGDAEKWKKRAVAIRDTLRRIHWNAEHSFFCDSVVDGEQAEIFTEVGNGMALYYDIADDFQKDRIVKKLTQDDNGCTKATTLYFYYFIEGLIRAGAIDYALKRLSRDNKDMMELTDPPTLWEQWPDVPSTHRAGNSPLHFGGAGVAWTLSSHVLGVQAAAPAFSACRIQPKCGRLSWARGVVPSVRGDIRVEWRKSADVFTISVVLPDAMPTKIFLPFKVRETSVLNHNGKRYARQGSKGRGKGISWSAEGLTVGVNGGNHTLEISG